MSMKPDDIPQSIWDSAWGAEAWARACYDPVTTTEADKINVVIAIARSIMAAVEEEREACVAIARHYDGLGRQPSEGAAYGDASLTQLDIASIIRNRSNSD